MTQRSLVLGGGEGPHPGAWVPRSLSSQITGIFSLNILQKSNVEIKKYHRKLCEGASSFVRGKKGPDAWVPLTSPGSYLGPGEVDPSRTPGFLFLVPGSLFLPQEII